MADISAAQIVIPKGDGMEGKLSDFARPFAIYAAAASLAATPIIVVVRMQADKLDMTTCAILVGAIGTALGAMYGLKSDENKKVVQANANVQIAQAQPAPTPS